MSPPTPTPVVAWTPLMSPGEDPDFPESIYDDTRPVSPFSYRWSCVDIDPSEYYIDRKENARLYPITPEKEAATPKLDSQAPVPLPSELKIIPESHFYHNPPSEQHCSDYPSSNNLTILERRQILQKVKKLIQPTLIIVVQKGERHIITNMEPQKPRAPNTAIPGVPEGYQPGPPKSCIDRYLDSLEDQEEMTRFMQALVGKMFPTNVPPKIGDTGIPNKAALNAILFARAQRQKMTAGWNERKRVEKLIEEGAAIDPRLLPPHLEYLPDEHLPNEGLLVNRYVNRETATNQEDPAANQGPAGIRVRVAGPPRDGGELAPAGTSSSGYSQPGYSQSGYSQSGTVGNGSSAQETVNENQHNVTQRTSAPRRIRIKLINWPPKKANDANDSVPPESSNDQQLDSEVPSGTTLNANRKSIPSKKGRDRPRKRKRTLKAKEEHDNADYVPDDSEVEDTPVVRKKTRKSRK
ncbi:hypothetical protein F4819DRAFT_509473 [Hypoxylon fuscum]|nr:hypothetical protein F4819DRAFT_509473 [Hypoxylon fuscum]